MYKNIDKQTKLTLKELVEYQEGQVVSKTLVQNDYVSMTIFSFDKGEEISTHAAGGDAMVTVLEGKGRFTVGDEVFYVEEGETLIMPKDIPHAVYGGMAGGIGSFLINMGSGLLFDYAGRTNMAFFGFEGKEAGYFIVFCICAIAYMLAWCIMKALVPKYKVIK